MSIKTVTVSCPSCDKRLFDLLAGAQGCIHIKCPLCRKIVTIELHKWKCDKCKCNATHCDKRRCDCRKNK